MFLSKEATSKDQQLKTQMMISLQDDEAKNTEHVWQKSGFFDDHRSDLTIPKVNFPKNTLVYVNQGSVSLVTGSGQAIYLDFVVIEQLMPVANPDPSINLETHVFQDNEALLYVPVYNKATGLYGGLTKKLAHIMLQGNANERFFSYGYSKEKSTLLYCTMKHPLPNIFFVLPLRNIMGFYLMKIKRKLTFQKCFYICLQLWIGKRIFCSGKGTFTYIRLM